MQPMITRIMRRGGRRIAWLAMVALLALPLVGLPNSTASAAGTKCILWPSADACVSVESSGVLGDAYHYSPGYFTDVTVYVSQCRGDGSACGTIAANHATNTNSINTSPKPVAYGHVYRTCASWTDNYGYHVVNQCSPFSSWP